MNPEELKQAWQMQTSQRRLAIDADALLKEVRHNERHFRQLIFRRDVREVGVTLLLVPLWLWTGLTETLHWTWYLCIPTFLWIAGFMVVDRMRQRQRQAEPGDPLWECVESSLAQVEHQIWLLRNVFWWYLLPPGVAIAAFFANCAWLARDRGLGAGLVMAGVIAFAALVLGGVYWLNQIYVCKELETRRRELQGLIADLNGANHLARPAEATDHESRD